MNYELAGLTRCKTCKHYIKGLICEAYLNGIPYTILTGMDKHSIPLKEHMEIYLKESYYYPSDGGIIYEEK